MFNHGPIIIRRTQNQIMKIKKALFIFLNIHICFQVLVSQQNQVDHDVTLSNFI